MTGTVLIGANNRFLVKTEQGIVSCTFKGKKLKTDEQAYNTLAPGDIVELVPVDSETGLITKLLPRRSLFWRYNEKGKAKQAIAANIDVVICVSSTGMPPWRPRFIDRVSVLAEMNELPLLIILNKCDLPVAPEILERLTHYESLGFATMQTSIYNEDSIERLRRYIQGKTAACIGQSGVGKSSLINALEPGLDFEIGDICEKYERGRHTTVAAVCAQLADSTTAIIDTPGIRRLALRYINPLELSWYFPEMHKLYGACKLGARCTHLHENGCAVRDALASGSIHPDRYQSYTSIWYELTASKEYAKKTGKPQHYSNYEDDE
ncbi:MAG TPA: ribosome small subunit-dependent GTPase A [Spirochaetales bacterium]|nr:ribosome small subunit-dependent GTPase A [Spirochaetales bacterium]HQK33845.1 ribosome small subunit-dependent GTPase A [Spirochaetales bacterium]